MLNNTHLKALGRCATQLALAAAVSLTAVAGASAEDKPGYYGVPRTWLWNPGVNSMVDTSKYKKDGPYVIGFSNASISNAWRVAFQHGVLWAAGEHKDEIAHFLVTDANDDPAKQINDIQDLISQGVDLLLIAPATEEALDSVVGRATRQGIPVVLVDRKVTTPENYITFITASDAAVGRIEATWLAEYLKGKGNIVMLPGVAGASPAEIRIRANKEVFAKYPDIKVLDMQYTNWNPATGKQVMAALLAEIRRPDRRRAGRQRPAGLRRDRGLYRCRLQERRDSARDRWRRRADVSALRRVQRADGRYRLPDLHGHHRCGDGA